MPTCEHCQALLLDFVYGLLEASELNEVREHLAGCSICQGALTAVESEQKMLARAARAVENVPELTLPTMQPGEVSSTAPTIPAIVPVQIPKPALWRRPWVLY